MPDRPQALRKAVVVHALTWRYVSYCGHRGCRGSADYRVEYGAGMVVERCYSHLIEDFGVNKVSDSKYRL